MGHFIHNGVRYNITAFFSHKNFFRTTLDIKQEGTSNCYTITDDWIDENNITIKGN